MKRFTAREVEGAVSGRLVNGGPGVVFSDVSIDSRSVRRGSLFFALKGSKVDGHDYVKDALDRGAAGAVISRSTGTGPSGGALIMVEDTLAALGMLAAEQRRLFRGTVVAVTGSVGKTTAKEMISSVLSTRFRVLKAEGNMNNEIGVPLTALKLGSGYDAGVFELAMRLRGEIAWLARIVRPSIGVITNISETHIERLGSLENIALTKAELLEALPGDGYAILNGDNEWIRKIRTKAACPAVFYGINSPADVSASGIDVRLDRTAFTLNLPSGSLRCVVPVAGEHQVYNALAAACVGLKTGLSPGEIKRGLEAFKPAAMRTEIVETRGITMINDAYNASPVSTKAALVMLSKVPGERKIAVLGNMLELGEYSVPGHRATGRAARDLGIDFVVAIGDLAAEIASGAIESGMDPASVKRVSSNSEAVTFLRGMLRSGDTVLVKGSRGARMEEVFRGLLED